MRIFQRIWEELRQGENLDVYLTVIIAIILSFITLTGLGTPKPEVVTAILLAVLALLAISNLKTRYVTEQVLEKLSLSAKTMFLEEFPASLQDDLAAASELWLVGVSLSRTLRHNYSEIERKLKKGDNVRVLLVHPEGPAAEIAASRPYPSAEVEQTRGQIRDSLGYLSKLKRTDPDKLQIRTIQNPLTHGFIAMNLDSPTGILYIEHYPYQTTGSVLPRFVLRAKDERWYGFYKSELINLWNSGAEWHGQQM